MASILGKSLLYCRKARMALRSALLRIFLRLCGCRVGKGLKCKAWPQFRQFPCRNIVIGDNVNIGPRVAFDICRNASLSLGDGVNLTQDIVIAGNQKVSIGKHTLIGEFVSIRDGDHGMCLETPMAFQKMTVSPVNIGDDVWIGAGVRILRGADIANGVVIAANAVVTRKTECPPCSIVGGIPAKVLKMRK